MGEYLKLEDLSAYNLAVEIGDFVWQCVINWEWLARKTIGSQLVDAADSIGANIAEGFGRFHKKDKIKFYYNSRGSTYETAHWCKRAFARKLLTQAEYGYLIERLRKMPIETNRLIKLTSHLTV